MEFDFNQSQGEATRRSFISDTKDQDILVLGTHFATPCGGYIISDADAWRFGER